MAEEKQQDASIRAYQCKSCCGLAMGVMNLAWVAVLTVFILAERIGPAGAIVARVADAILIGFRFMLVWR